MIVPVAVQAFFSVAWEGVLKFFSMKTVQRYLLLGVVGFGLLFFAYQRGYSDRERVCLEAETTRVEQALLGYQAEVSKQREADAARAERDTTLITDLAAESRRIRNLTNNLTGHIDELAEASSAVQLSAGALRLLNEARTGGASEGTVPGSASGTAYSDPAASGVGLSDLIRDGVLTAEQYNTSRNQCNALIEWANRELVDANKARRQ